MTTHTVNSPDGTPIAYWTAGNGPSLVAVHGTSSDHTSWRFVGPLLEPRITLHAIDRRGRGASGDGPDYAIEREFEDVAAVLRAVAAANGGPVDLLGHSYGALCALGAARLAGDALRRLVLYEPPTLGSRAVVPEETAQRLAAMVDDGRPEEMLELFYLEIVGMSPEELAWLRDQPVWAARVAAAATVPRECWAERAFDPEPYWLKTVTAPTMMLLGGESPPWAAEATEFVRGALPDARVEVMPGQGHVATLTGPDLLAERLIGFLLSR